MKVIRSTVMAFAGEDFECVSREAENNAVGLVDAYAPPSGKVAAQWLGIADAVGAVAFDALNEHVDASERFRVLPLPVEIVLPGVFVPDLTHGRVLRLRSDRARLGCVRRPYRGRGARVRGCCSRNKTGRRSPQKAICRAEGTAE